MSSTNTKTFSFLYIHTKKIMAYALRKLLIKFISLLRTSKLAPLKKQLINIFSFLSTGYCDKWLYYAIFVIMPKSYARSSLRTRSEMVCQNSFLHQASLVCAQSSLRIGKFVRYARSSLSKKKAGTQRVPASSIRYISEDPSNRQDIVISRI